MSEIQGSAPPPDPAIIAERMEEVLEEFGAGTSDAAKIAKKKTPKGLETIRDKLVSQGLIDPDASESDIAAAIRAQLKLQLKDAGEDKPFIPPAKDPPADSEGVQGKGGLKNPHFDVGLKTAFVMAIQHMADESSKSGEVNNELMLQGLAMMKETAEDAAKMIKKLAHKKAMEQFMNIVASGVNLGVNMIGNMKFASSEADANYKKETDSMDNNIKKKERRQDYINQKSGTSTTPAAQPAAPATGDSKPAVDFQRTPKDQPEGPVDQTGLAAEQEAPATAADQEHVKGMDKQGEADLEGTLEMREAGQDAAVDDAATGQATTAAGKAAESKNPFVRIKKKGQDQLDSYRSKQDAKRIKAEDKQFMQEVDDFVAKNPNKSKQEVADHFKKDLEADRAALESMTEKNGYKWKQKEKSRLQTSKQGWQDMTRQIHSIGQSAITAVFEVQKGEIEAKLEYIRSFLSPQAKTFMDSALQQQQEARQATTKALEDLNRWSSDIAKAVTWTVQG